MNRRIILLGLGLLLALAQCTMAGVPAKIRTWSQLPDLAEPWARATGGQGWASQLYVPSIVADDWLCEDGSPVTDIHWWGTYWDAPGSTYTPSSETAPNAIAGNIERFIIRIYSDVPKDPGDAKSYSHPGLLLKTYTITDPQEWDPMKYAQVRVDGIVRDVYQYYTVLPEAFEQVQGNVYWLSIQADLFDTRHSQWGWWESYDHWNDAAVQDYRRSGWEPLSRNGHEVDVAFELFKQEGESSVPEPGSLTALAIGLLGLAALRKWIAE